MTNPIPTAEQFATALPQLPGQMEQLRGAALTYAEQLQRARVGASERAVSLFTGRHPEDTEALARHVKGLQLEQWRLAACTANVQRAAIQVPRVEPNTYIVYGRLLGASGEPLANVAISLVDASGTVHLSGGTDPRGYYRLSLPVSEAAAPGAMHLLVTDAEQAVLGRDVATLAPAGGKVVFRELTLGGARRPPAPQPPAPGTRVAPGADADGSAAPPKSVVVPDGGGRGPEVKTAVVPDLMNKTLEAAGELISAAGFQQVQTKGPRDGLIVGQQPKALETKPLNTLIELTLVARTAGPSTAFVSSLAERIAQETAFAKLGISVDDLTDRLAALGVDTRAKATELAALKDEEFARRFGIDDPKIATALRRVVASALKKAEGPDI